MEQQEKECPVCGASVSRRNTPGQDFIWDAVPLMELLEIAQAKAKDCAQKSDDEIRSCAEQIVRSQVCTCCSAETAIINSVVDEFVQQLRTAS